ncbi:hypothetical protein L6164_018073 [Bauhinia variegata]|uniref:Uncharacterized protein n=1 Tax=Bauhinia variegata TaxID=167791 RepID=A0ACB9NA38_BAUVA|nr:hypothetical protein L6164_018073 [Bauhinia variegata]
MGLSNFIFSKAITVSAIFPQLKCPQQKSNTEKQTTMGSTKESGGPRGLVTGRESKRGRETYHALRHSSFCGPPPSPTTSVFDQSRKQKNLILHKQLHSRLLPKTKTATLKISCLGPGLFDQIAQLAQNKVLIAAGVSAAVGQFPKPFTSVWFYGKEFDLKAIIQAGGFPSTHSSATVASATFIGVERGFSDPIFGLTVVYAGLIMYDAQTQSIRF